MALGTFRILLLSLTIFQVLCAPPDVTDEWRVDIPVEHEGIEKHILRSPEASWTDFSYVVYFKWNGDFLCSGTLISEQYVLTAASCMIKTWWDGVTVTVGAKMLSQTKDIATLKIPQSNIFIHPSYIYQKHDIAVVKLPRKLSQFKDKVWLREVWPVKLSNEVHQWDSGFEALLVGWGANSSSSNELSNSLRVGDVLMLPRKNCDDLFLDRDYHQMDPYQICSMDTRNAPCYGDLGGPVVAQWSRPSFNHTLVRPLGYGDYFPENSTQEYQIGIITTERTENIQCQSGRLETYTFLPPYYNWILSVIMLKDHLDSLI